MSNHSKLDHALRHIMRHIATAAARDRDSKSRAVPDRSDLVAPFFSTVELARHVSREGKLDVVIRSNDAVRAGKHIEHLGGTVHAPAGARVITARIPAEKMILEAADARASSASSSAPS